LPHFERAALLRPEDGELRAQRDRRAHLIGPRAASTSAPAPTPTSPR
jgi:hypothetical protein